MKFSVNLRIIDDSEVKTPPPWYYNQTWGGVVTKHLSRNLGFYEVEELSDAYGIKPDELDTKVKVDTRNSYELLYSDLVASNLGSLFTSSSITLSVHRAQLDELFELKLGTLDNYPFDSRSHWLSYAITTKSLLSFIVVHLEQIVKPT